MGSLNGHKRGTSYFCKRRHDDKTVKLGTNCNSYSSDAQIVEAVCWLDLPRVFFLWCDRMLRLGPYPPPLIEISDPEENQHLAGRVSGML